MKKFFLLLLLTTILFGCVNKGQRTRVVEKTLPIEMFIDTFIKQNPNYALNDITIDETNKLFAKTILDTLKSTNLLCGVPMKLKGMNKNGKHTMVHFQTWYEPSGWEYRGIVNEVNVDIITSVDKSFITMLEKEKYYRIYGKLVDRLNYNAVPILYGKTILVYNPNISIEEDDIRDDRVNVNLGILYYSIDSIKPFNGRDKEIIKY